MFSYIEWNEKQYIDVDVLIYTKDEKVNPVPDRFIFLIDHNSLFINAFNNDFKMQIANLDFSIFFYIYDNKY